MSYINDLREKILAWAIYILSSSKKINEDRKAIMKQTFETNVEIDQNTRNMI